MYFAATAYPVFHGHSKKAVRAVVTEALRHYDPWAKWRFYAVLLAVLVVLPLPAYFKDTWQLPEWTIWPVALYSGLVFYVYLLWEINGPMYRAVQKHLAGQ